MFYEHSNAEYFMKTLKITRMFVSRVTVSSRELRVSGRLTIFLVKFLKPHPQSLSSTTSSRAPPFFEKYILSSVNVKEQAEKLSAKPNFDHCSFFSEELVAIHMKKTRLVFDKPVYLGMCILDLSKILMYHFHI